MFEKVCAMWPAAEAKAGILLDSARSKPDVKLGCKTVPNRIGTAGRGGTAQKSIVGGERGGGIINWGPSQTYSKGLSTLVCTLSIHVFIMHQHIRKRM